jgi:ABC-type phosphate transport system substrate-binding protein
MVMPKQLAAIGCGLLLQLVVSAACAEVVVVVVVSIQNPVHTLSREELADIYLGRVMHLSSGDLVVPIDQAERSRAHDEFYREYLGRSAAQIKAHWSRLIFTGRGRPPWSVANDEAIVEIIAGNPKAIGYTDLRFVDDRLRVVKID